MQEEHVWKPLKSTTHFHDWELTVMHLTKSITETMVYLLVHQFKFHFILMESLLCQLMWYWGQKLFFTQDGDRKRRNQFFHEIYIYRYLDQNWLKRALARFCLFKSHTIPEAGVLEPDPGWYVVGWGDWLYIVSIRYKGTCFFVITININLNKSSLNCGAHMLIIFEFLFNRVITSYNKSS